MVFGNPYWSKAIHISLLQRWLIVHSILYYELNTSIITDKAFDDNAHQLVELQEQYPKEAQRSEYYYLFNDFDGSTGFHLYHRLNEHDKQYLMQIAGQVQQRDKGR